MKKVLATTIIMALSAVICNAQSGTNSPYSQYGIGLLSDQSQGFNRGMNGVGLGLRKGNVVNTLNPASYSAIDSLTMIFDVGVSGQITSFKEGGKKVNANNAGFEYAVGSFRLLPSVGIGFGILPYSSIGYNYYSSKELDVTGETIQDTYSGSGGIHQAFVGAGWRVAKPLSIGINLAYIWGTYEKRISSTSSTSSTNSLAKSYSGTISNYNLEVGLQWEQEISSTDKLIWGATVGIGHNLGCELDCKINEYNTLSGNTDTRSYVVENGLSLPMSYGVGMSWNHAEKVLVALDMSTQQWGKNDYPFYDSQADNYRLTSGLLKDRYKVNLGADFVPNPLSRHLLSRVHYRMGVGYSTPYYKINGADGPKELSASFGFGLPLQNRHNNRSFLNVSAQWVHSSANQLITENTFRINLGLTFNERWFMKWKIE